MQADLYNTVNQNLIGCYEARLPELKSHIENCIQSCNWPREQVSNIFAMHVDEAYLIASPKIMFVGRETFGWYDSYNSSLTAYELIDFYARVKESHHNSPFWWFRERFSESMGVVDQCNPSHFMQATLWTNLSKIDVNKTTPSGEAFGHLSQLFIQLLVEEIAIAEPDIVLIMTTNGHYNWHLNNYNWADNTCYDSNNQKPGSLTRQQILSGKIERLIAEGRLPKHTYQIPHPNYLYKKKMADEVLNFLVKQITES